MTRPHDDSPPEAQERYQVRFDVGVDGAHRIGETADLIVWCDAIVSVECPVDALPLGAEVVDATLVSAPAIAQRLLSLQAERGARTMVAIIAAGSPRDRTASLAVEDLLLAGAVVDALGAVGIDATSPEAAAAAAAYHGLRGAVGHMLTASVAGRALVAQKGTAAIATARARLEGAEHRTLREWPRPAARF